MTPEQLWEKHLHNDMYATKAGFFAALTEYGNAVKADAVKVLEDDWFAAAESDCGGAIKGMKLP